MLRGHFLLSLNFVKKGLNLEQSRVGANSQTTYISSKRSGKMAWRVDILKRKKQKTFFFFCHYISPETIVVQLFRSSTCLSKATVISWLVKSPAHLRGIKHESEPPTSAGIKRVYQLEPGIGPPSEESCHCRTNPIKVEITQVDWSHDKEDLAIWPSWRSVRSFWMRRFHTLVVHVQFSRKEISLRNDKTAIWLSATQLRPKVEVKLHEVFQEDRTLPKLK